jgi:hypothetical protein
MSFDAYALRQGIGSSRGTAHGQLRLVAVQRSLPVRGMFTRTRSYFGRALGAKARRLASGRMTVVAFAPARRPDTVVEDVASPD